MLGLRLGFTLGIEVVGMGEGKVVVGTMEGSVVGVVEGGEILGSTLGETEGVLVGLNVVSKSYKKKQFFRTTVTHLCYQ